MTLVVQGDGVAADALRERLAPLGARSAEQRSATAVAVHGVAPDQAPAVRDLCATAGWDCAFVPEDRSWRDVGLVVMDMDSTLIAIECIDELADDCGLKDRVAAITARAMAGELDFTQSLRERVALLEGLGVATLERVYRERLRFNPGAERLIAGLKRLGVRTLLVSGGFTFFTERVRERLGLDYAAANELEVVDGRLTGRVLGPVVDAQGKAEWLRRTCNQLSLAPRQAIAVGDGANDLEMMAAAGFSVAYHAKPKVRERADCALDHVGLDGVLDLFPEAPPGAASR